MTTVPRPDDLDASYTCAYDAWNRLVEVKDGARVHARYEYDALNRRVKAHVDSDLTGGPDTWVHFYYTNDWRLLETRETTSTGGGGGCENDQPENLQPYRQYVWSVRYTDALVRRDANTGADDLCDDETLYALGDANFNTTALVNASGTVQEHYGSCLEHRQPVRLQQVLAYSRREGPCDQIVTTPGDRQAKLGETTRSQAKTVNP